MFSSYSNALVVDPFKKTCVTHVLHQCLFGLPRYFGYIKFFCSKPGSCPPQRLKPSTSSVRSKLTSFACPSWSGGIQRLTAKRQQQNGNKEMMEKKQHNYWNGWKESEEKCWKALVELVKNYNSRNSENVKWFGIQDFFVYFWYTLPMDLRYPVWATPKKLYSKKPSKQLVSSKPIHWISAYLRIDWTQWLNQPLWKVCTPQNGWTIFPNFRGENSKKYWAEQLPPSSYCIWVFP